MYMYVYTYSMERKKIESLKRCNLGGIAKGIYSDRRGKRPDDVVYISSKMFIYTCVYVYKYMHVYIMYTYMCMYTCIYVCIYTTVSLFRDEGLGLRIGVFFRSLPL